MSLVLTGLQLEELSLKQHTYLFQINPQIHLSTKHWSFRERNFLVIWLFWNSTIFFFSESKALSKNALLVIGNRGGNGTPLQYSRLENHMDGGAWWAAVRGVARSQTRLSDFTFTFHFHALEKEMATHSSVLAWRIPGTEEPGGLPSMGSLRVGCDWSDLAAAAAVIGKKPMIVERVRQYINVGVLILP